MSLQPTSRSSCKRTPTSQRNTCTPSRRAPGAAPGHPRLPPPTASAPTSVPKARPLGRSLFARSWTRAEGSGEARPVLSCQPVSHSRACCPCPALSRIRGGPGRGGPCTPPKGKPQQLAGQLQPRFRAVRGGPSVALSSPRAPHPLPGPSGPVRSGPGSAGRRPPRARAGVTPARVSTPAQSAALLGARGQGRRRFLSISIFAGAREPFVNFI